MKKYFIITTIFTVLMNSACQNDFLDREPLDATTSDVFFETPGQMRAYLNTFYNRKNFPKYANHGSDFNSDNEVAGTPDIRLQGTRVVSTTGTIGFGDVRRINFFFDNYRRVEANHELEEYQQYLGEAYFFRGLIYFNLMQSYGDIQIITKELNTDSPELYNPRDPRNKVADFIIQQLDSAAIYLTADKTSGAGRINRWMALLIQSRVALYEGSWEKYHDGTPFGVDDADPDKYFTKAAEAAEELIDGGVYSIYSTGNPGSDYKDLFSLLDYSTNSEVMFWQNFDQSVTQGDGDFTNDRFFRMKTPTNKTITKQLADTYLCTDGRPISGNTLFGGYNTLASEAENRDPRFYQTIATPDQVWQILPDGDIEYWSDAYNKLNSTADYNAPGGYIIQKGYNPNTTYHVQQYEESPGLIYRYAEALLNFAEARAELGTLSQADIDKSIKLLRDRVGMPNLVLSDIATDPNWDFPDLPPVINEIRRERRVELAAEGFRWDDIARWAAADELIVGTRPKGFKASQIAENPFPVDENGFLDPFRNAIPEGYGFKLDRDYLNSIPESEITLNDNLTQNPGW
ncbi:RagB/SusD family nutrient uptake outer membrane protein [Sinomicrobium weinanense]|uniref:RagB/SusD family nutrient uptake outer membrane protein n=1 Tax=Sinomicrobium weinanense TaxID=2842200 RepID=A0A926JTI4_9FLAO|nr:RagB/SusD family nutrient uptake outer membrane protein [Sinomicrobium weinanense]MBC9797233.1 RagB/SusD family nutrient uptake outer membrane protein [Sinomicrobium weinanense]MBU3125554.1 RagB/SusD family nutrient uptake outer membrane protein [Sinomicrobium weinanense]